MERGYWGHYLTTEMRALLRAAAGVDHFSLDTRSCLHLQSLNPQNETGRRLGTEQNA